MQFVCSSGAGGSHLLLELPVQSGEEAAGSQQDRALRENRPLVVDPLQVVLGDGRHADGPRRTVQELIAVSVRDKWETSV